MRHFALVAISFAVLLSLPVSAKSAERPAENAIFEPAVFRIDNFSLAEQISFPRDYKAGQDFSLSVACAAVVTREGRLKYPYCLGGNEETRSFEQRILLATKRSKMIPARVEGTRKPVAFNFTSIFRRVNGEASVTVVPNHFLNVDKFGMSYSAPQLLTRDTKGFPRTCRGMNVMMKITVDSAGVASDPHLHAGDQNAKGCIQAISTQMSRLRYLPGTVDGVPTKMEHLYMVQWRGGWAVTGSTTR